MLIVTTTIDHKALLTPRGMRDMHFWESTLNVTIRAHFLAYWLGLYTAPEVGQLPFQPKNMILMPVILD